MKTHALLESASPVRLRIFTSIILTSGAYAGVWNLPKPSHVPITFIARRSLSHAMDPQSPSSVRLRTPPSRRGQPFAGPLPARPRPAGPTHCAVGDHGHQYR